MLFQANRDTTQCLLWHKKQNPGCGLLDTLDYLSEMYQPPPPLLKWENVCVLCFHTSASAVFCSLCFFLCFLYPQAGLTRLTGGAWLFQCIPNSMNYSSIQQLSENLLTNHLFLCNTSSISSHTVQSTHSTNNLTWGEQRRSSLT